MKTLNERVEDNKDLFIDYFKEKSGEKEGNIKEVNVEVRGRQVIGTVICDFRDDPDIERLFGMVENEDGQWELYNELKDRRYNVFYMDLREAIDFIKSEGRDKKIEKLLNDR